MLSWKAVIVFAWPYDKDLLLCFSLYVSASVMLEYVQKLIVDFSYFLYISSAGILERCNTASRCELLFAQCSYYMYLTYVLRIT